MIKRLKMRWARRTARRLVKTGLASGAAYAITVEDPHGHRLSTLIMGDELDRTAADDRRQFVHWRAGLLVSAFLDSEAYRKADRERRAAT